jgi:hypothetical protein
VLHHNLRTAIYTLAILGTLVAILAATPFGEMVTDDQRSIATLAAALGGVKWIIRRMLAPAHELFAAGKMIGRMEAGAPPDQALGGRQEAPGQPGV